MRRRCTRGTSVLTPLKSLRRIGIDEISYKKGHKYLTVVVDHDSGRLVRVAEGRNAATLRGFFDLLGPERCAQITHVTARNSQILWIGCCQATSDTGVSGDGSGVMSTGRSRSLPLWKTAPARTNATRCGALTARHRAWAASISL